MGFRYTTCVLVALAALPIVGSSCQGPSHEPNENQLAKQPAPPPPVRKDRALPVKDRVLNDELPADLAWRKIMNDAEEEEHPKGKPWDPFFKLPKGPPSHDARNALKKANEAYNAEKSPENAYDGLTDLAAIGVAKGLPADPTILQQQHKQVLILSGINQRGPVVGSGAPTVLRDLYVKFFHSKELKDSFIFLTGDAKDGQEAMKRAGAGQPFMYQDPTGGGGADAEMVSYHPDSIYSLTAEFANPVLNRQQHLFRCTMFVSVTKARSNSLSLSDKYAMEYRFHPYRQAWISKDEDDELGKAYDAK